MAHAPPPQETRPSVAEKAEHKEAEVLDEEVGFEKHGIRGLHENELSDEQKKLEAKVMYALLFC